MVEPSVVAPVEIRKFVHAHAGPLGSMTAKARVSAIKRIVLLVIFLALHARAFEGRVVTGQCPERPVPPPSEIKDRSFYGISVGSAQSRVE
jgi:hypothetical protein